jgi:hypothetical protein
VPTENIKVTFFLCGKFCRKILQIKQINRQEKRSLEMFSSTQLIVAVIQYGFREIENETEGDERMKQK